MFNDPGKSLKVFAWVIVIATIIIFLVREATVGLMYATLGIEQSPFSLLLAAVLGYLVGQIFGLLLYAFGELVQSVTTLRKKFCGEMQKERDIPLPDEDYELPKAKRGNDGRWCCPVCDQLNVGKNDRCEHCSAKVVFE